MKKILLGTLVGLVVLIVGLVVFILVSWDKTYEVPMPELQATTDSSAIARGKYLAYGPAHCATCHVPMDKISDIEKGEQIPLSGGWKITIPPGTFRAPNLTPDEETGIGKITDGQLARALRYSIFHDGSTMPPFMPFQELSDDDVIALISFLRSQPKVKHVVKPKEFTFLGKALLAFGIFKPTGPESTPAKTVVIDSTAEYGQYISHRVANCVGCHTERDMKTGKFTGIPFAGGMKFEPGMDSVTNGYGFVTPNLTPDKATGVMAAWDEQTFINRFRAGRIQQYSPMPWGVFSRMTELELKAVYRYLHSLEPVTNKIEQTVIPPQK